jgi:hypothetical protein
LRAVAVFSSISTFERLLTIKRMILPTLAASFAIVLSGMMPDGCTWMHSLTHPDADHIRGLKNHFHLGAPNTRSKTTDRIIIRDMWSSPIVFRRASKEHLLCNDANAWAAEARRRVRLYRENGLGSDGDRIKILGEDIDGKTDDLEIILVKTGETFSTICSKWDGIVRGAHACSSTRDG